MSDGRFKKAGEAPRNLKICAHKSWGQRMLIETLFSLITRVCWLKHLPQRIAISVETHLGWVAALFNLLLTLHRCLEPEAAVEDRLLKIAQFALCSSTIR